MKQFKIEEVLTYNECVYLRGILLREETKLNKEFKKVSSKGISPNNVVSKIEELHNIYRKLDVQKTNNYNW